MKKVRLSIAVLLSIWSLAVNADNGSVVSGVNVEKSEQKKVRLYTQTAEPVEVAIIDADGNLLYQGNVAKGQKGTTSFNLNGLPDGQYYLTATNNTYWMSQVLTIRGNVVTVDERSQKQILQPTVSSYEKNKFEVVLPAKNVDAANIAIYDSQNVLVQAGALKGTAGRFDLSSLPEGTYTFVVGPDQKQFFSKVEIKH